MQVQVIQNNNTNFNGKFFKDYSFRRLEKNLSGKEKEYWQKIVSNIENTKDDNYWWFGFAKIHNDVTELARIGRLDSQGRPYRPAMFNETVTKESDAIKVFEYLNEWYRNNIKEFKG